MRTKNRRPLYEREQENLDLQTDTMRIMQLLILHQRPDDGLSWTSEAIGVHLTDAQPWQVKDALLWLQRRGYIELIRGSRWSKTTEGEQWYNEEFRRTELNTGASDYAFRHEALTGMTEGGRRSRLKWAALPSPARNYAPGNRIEREIIELCLRYNRIRAIAAKLGRTIEETNEGFASGEIHTCNQCGELKPHHRDNSKDGWQIACVDCRKVRRKRA